METENNPAFTELKVTYSSGATKYIAGESFRFEYITVKGIDTDGQEHLLSPEEYDYYPQGALCASTTAVTIMYRGLTANIDIEVQGDPHTKGVYLQSIEHPFVKVTAINGKPPEYDGEPLEVATPGSFDLHVDIFGYLESIGKTIEELDTCILTIPGKVRSLNDDVHCAVYSSTDSEKFICDAINGGNAYHFLLKRIYEETGNCDFRVFIDNPFVNCKNAVASYEDDYPHEIFSVARSFFSLDMSIGGEKLTIEHAPNKCKYIIGESFDRTGLAVCLHYPNGESVLVNDFTVHNETQPFSEYSTHVTVRYGNLTVECPIEIEGQYVPCTHKTLRRDRRNDGTWTEWQDNTSPTHIGVSKNDAQETKSIITLDRRYVALGGRKRTGLQVRLQNVSDTRPRYIKINGIRQTLSQDAYNYLYLGEVSAENTFANEPDILEVTLEYDDGAAEFGFFNPAPVYFCEALDPASQAEEREFALADDVQLSVDLLRGTETVTITPFTANDNLLGATVSLAYNRTDHRLYGPNFRFAVGERLEISTEDHGGPIPTPVYTQPSGAQYAFGVLYYKWDNNGNKMYLADANERQNIVRNENGDLSLYTEAIFAEYMNVQGCVYCPEMPAAITDNADSREILQSIDEYERPVQWLKCGNLYKGFDKTGKLAICIDAFSHYVKYTYQGDEVKSLSDGKNRIDFYYRTVDGLPQPSSIVGSYGKRAEFTYTESRLTAIRYYDAKTGGNNTKTVTVDYRMLSDGAIPTYAVSGVTCSDNTRSAIEYEELTPYDHRLHRITHYAAAPGLPETEEKCAEFTMHYSVSDHSVEIENEDGDRERYDFDEHGALIGYFRIACGYVADAELYEYEPFQYRKTHKALPIHCNRYLYPDFRIKCNGSYHTVTTRINAQNMPTSVTESYPLTENVNKTTSVSYVYGRKPKRHRRTL